MKLTCDESEPAVETGHRELAVKCCNCHRVRVHNRWIHDPGRPAGGLTYTHGYCPDCYTVAMSELIGCRMALR